MSDYSVSEYRAVTIEGISYSCTVSHGKLWCEPLLCLLQCVLLIVILSLHWQHFGWHITTFLIFQLIVLTMITEILSNIPAALYFHTWHICVKSYMSSVLIYDCFMFAIILSLSLSLVSASLCFISVYVYDWMTASWCLNFYLMCTAVTTPRPPSHINNIVDVHWNFNTQPDWIFFTDWLYFKRSGG